MTMTLQLPRTARPALVLGTLMILAPTTRLTAAEIRAQASLTCPIGSTLRADTKAWGSRLSCWTEQGMEGPVLDLYGNGSKRSQFTLFDGSRVGPFTDWHPNGKPCRRGQYQTTEEAPENRGEVEIGPWAEWYPDGSHRAEGTYEKGQLEGVFRAWGPGHPDILRRETSWKQGKANGTWRSFYPDGMPELLVTWADGMLNGPVVRWAKNGHKTFECAYARETLNGICRSWDEHGALLVEAGFAEGRKHGRYEEHNANGRLKLSQTYVDGELNGPVKSWFENGKLEKEETYVSGHRQPGWKHYYDTGALDESLSKDGAYCGWYPSGAKSMEGKLVVSRNGQERREGRWLSYQEDGKLESIKNYRHGTPEGEFLWFDEQGLQKKREVFHDGMGAIRCPPGAKAKAEPQMQERWCVDSHGEKHGPDMYWNMWGSVNIFNYAHGKRHGQEINGGYERMWVDGELHGPAIIRYDDGRKFAEGAYSHGNAMGTWSYWYKDGTLASRGSFVKDQKDGPWIFFRKDGSKWTEATFANGNWKYWRAFEPDGSLAKQTPDYQTILEAMPQDPMTEMMRQGMGNTVHATENSSVAASSEPSDSICASTLGTAFSDDRSGEWNPEPIDSQP